MSERWRAYRFKTAAQWQQCLAGGFDVAADGSLRPFVRLGLAATQVTSTGRAVRVAADAPDRPLWRLHSPDRVTLAAFDELGQVSRPFEVDRTLADAFRWVVDPRWLWAFDATTVRRYERETVSADLVVPQELAVRDLASDGHRGVWLLLEAADGRWWLRHLDCEGRRQVEYPAPRNAGAGLQLGVVARGKRLLLLAKDRRLFILDAPTGEVLRAFRHWSHGPCWQPDRLTTDLRNGVAILSHDPANPTRWAVFILDAEGDTRDIVTGPPPPRDPDRRVNDVAIAGGVLWLAADDGLWRLDSTDASVARESESVLLTPALYSPQTGAGGGWLRAELSIDLPRGAVIEAEAMGTDDDRVADEARRIGGDLERTVAQRQQAIWDLFDHETSRVFHLTAAPGTGPVIAVPLFHVPDRWLWLRLKLVTPPGTAPPPIRELRILYPDASIGQRLPAIFRGRENDPTAFVRSLVGVLETTTQSIDEKIRSIASHLDPDTAPAPWLDYVARWLDLPWDDGLPLDSKRRILQHAGELLEHRGTRRGLQALLDALIGRPGGARVADLTVDHPPARIGGRDCDGGARLPMLLAGPAADAAVLGVRAVLGRACLGVPCDPLRSVVPALRIAASAPRAVQRVLEPVMGRVLAQYVPAGLKVDVVWRVVPAGIAPDGADDVEVLDANGPGRLNEDSELGRVIIGRRGGDVVDGAGLNVGFRLS